MFAHLVERNNLDDEFKKYLKEDDLCTDKMFIMELIERPSDDGAQVHEHEILFNRFIVFK